MLHNTIGRRAASTIRFVAAALTVGGLLMGCTTDTSHTLPSNADPTATSDGHGGSNSGPSATPSGLNTTDDTASTVESTASTVESVTVPSTIVTTTSSTTTTEPPTTTTLVVQGAIVKVANATKVPGGATKLTKLLADYGFQMAEATDAAGSEEFRDTTQVYCLPGSEPVAGSISTVLGGVPVNYMPTPAPITDATVGLGDSSVLVMLGKDLAGKTPPGLKP